ncbi:hypothetical protein BGZ96_009262 [Linnemannia gamsii]|uniref:Uncharacterized protein n=1 Tax=Linnemannia gamsii TaxID=64522 RepID=A0ABQ7JXF8_9FUNG|nr:hypothetical protein BGZ96_009262 [Linnemannia gamsii]
MEHLLKKHMQIDNKAHVDHILVTGTSSRIPEAIQLLEQYFENRLAVPQLIDPALASKQALAKHHQQEQKEKRRQEKNTAATASQKQSGKVSLSAAQDRSSSSSASKKTKRSSRRRHAAQYPQQQHPEGFNDNMNSSINNGGGLGDTIISTAVHGAIRLKQSPIPDVVNLELSKNGIEKAIELDEQYAIHEVVTETVFATLTGLVKAGIAYKESPSYAAVRAAASDNGKIAAAPQVQVLESASSSRLHHPQWAQPTSTRKSDHKSKKAALKEKEKEKEKAAAAAAAAASARSSITSRWTRRPQSVVVESETSSDSEEDSEDSDSSSDSDSEVEQKSYKKNSKSNHKIAPSSSSSSAFSSASSSSCSSTAGSGADNSDDSGDSDNETVELNREILRSSTPVSGRGGAAYHQHHQDTSKLPPPPPYSEQVREKIDMFMALKGAASLLVGSL